MLNPSQYKVLKDYTIEQARQAAPGTLARAFYTGLALGFEADPRNGEAPTPLMVDLALSNLQKEAGNAE